MEAAFRWWLVGAREHKEHSGDNLKSLCLAVNCSWKYRIVENYVDGPFREHLWPSQKELLLPNVYSDLKL